MGGPNALYALQYAEGAFFREPKSDCEANTPCARPHFVARWRPTLRRVGTSNRRFALLHATAYTDLVLDALRQVLSADPRIAYALVFGSTARGTSHALSDVDIAIGTTGNETLATLEIGALTSKLEAAANRAVHLVVLNDAPPGLAYRIFKDARPLLMRDAAAFKSRLARAILEYLDYRPVEELFTRGVLRASDGR